MRRSIFVVVLITACDPVGMIGLDATTPVHDATTPVHDAATPVLDAATPDGGRDDADAAPRVPYPSVLELHARAIAPTCSLNAGVCHNASSYPDLRTVSALIATIGLPCGLSAVRHEEFPGACEQRGDDFVVPGAEFDAEVLGAYVASTDPTTALPSEVVLTFDDPVPDALVGLQGFEVRRGARVFPLSPEDKVSIASVSGRGLTLAIRIDDEASSVGRFFDIGSLEYPTDSTIRWADANGDGDHTSHEPHRLIVPGRALDSYMIMRLVDPTLGELMPRQCRTWSDEATRALACWIEGLETDASGASINAYDPIDYDGCEVSLPAGRCGAVTGEGRGAVQAILARSCGGSGCHIGEAAPAAGLDLGSEHAPTALLGPSTERPGAQLVVPGDPAASYLLCKLEETCAERGSTARMPLGGALSEVDLAIIREWIAAGAE
jgi:hypothetical protein